MSPALVLTLALAGGHDYCPSGFTAQGSYTIPSPVYPAGGCMPSQQGAYGSVYGSSSYGTRQQGYGAAGGGYGMQGSGAYGQQGRRGAPIVYMTDQAGSSRHTSR